MAKVKDKAPISASYESRKYHDTKPGSLHDAVMQMQVNEQKSVTIRVDKLSALIETYLARGGVSRNLSPLIAEEKLSEVLPLQAVREFIDTYNRFFLTNYKAEEFVVEKQTQEGGPPADGGPGSGAHNHSGAPKKTQKAAHSGAADFSKRYEKAKDKVMSKYGIGYGHQGKSLGDLSKAKYKGFMKDLDKAMAKV